MPVGEPQATARLPQATAGSADGRSVCLPVAGIPRVTVAERGRRSSSPRRPPPRGRGQVFRYRAKRHRNLPHVVKFSGGRSSGMLLFTLLENRLLDASRGDVIIFNNTSAEHPDTYRFAKDCRSAAEHYGVPFFWTEFQTYEDARNGEWTRLPTYRLVNDLPKSDENPDGFHWRGEVFEELLSWSGYVPNQFGRICTQHLKLQVTRLFLKDWLASKVAIPRLGHYGHGSRIEPEVMYRRHRRNGGAVPPKIFHEKRRFSLSRPHVRPEQRYGDYAVAWTPFTNDELDGRCPGGEAVFGAGGVEYVAFVGLRGDEQPRVQRVEARRDHPHAVDYEGEHVYMPLAEMSIGRPEVNRFWARQSWDLALPKEGSLSNCVFCFLKGISNLRSVFARMETEREIFGFGSLAGTPCDVRWWTEIEKKYGRDLHAEGRPTNGNSPTDFIGFFGGSSDFSYRSLQENRAEDVERYGQALLPCDCTE